jgi:phytanoyl-CoA hydroxylase
MQALADYDESGLHLEKNVLDVAACDELIAVATEFPAVKNGDYRTVLQPHRTSGSFTALLSCPAIVGIMRQILGDKISAIQSQFFYGKPGTPGFQPHQDNRFVNAPAGQFASVWIALTDVSKENGGLYMYPGTHREPLLDVVEVPFEESLLQDRNALRLRCVIPEKYQPVDLSMPRGSAAFFDGSTVHGSHQNNSDRYRYAVLLTYIVRGSPFVAGQYAQREEVPID